MVALNESHRAPPQPTIHVGIHDDPPLTFDDFVEGGYKTRPYGIVGDDDHCNDIIGFGDFIEGGHKARPYGVGGDDDHCDYIN